MPFRGTQALTRVGMRKPGLLGSEVQKLGQLTSAMSSKRLLGILVPQGSPPPRVVRFLTTGLS